MSLATRCTACGTSFRVVQDQLKISEGWVRCGQCDAVFNALEGLFDLGRELNAGWEDLPAPAVTPTPETSLPDGAHGPPAPAEYDELDDNDEGPTSNLGELLADPIDAHLFGPRRRAESAPKPAGQVVSRDRVEFSDARFDSDLFAENAAVAEDETLMLPSTDAGMLPLEVATRPDFLRRAERQAMWRSAGMRSALGAASALAVLVLVLQVVNHGRDALAAQYPSLRAPLVAWCDLVGCTLQRPRRIDEVIVDSTALTRATGQDAFVLAVNLKSRSALALAMPSIDLTLTDGQGRLVARRALSPQDFRAADVLPPGGDAALQVTLSAGTPSVVGYTVEIFYP
ncbi:MAG: zinc-ribbon and DUF3426 domain-containing protein [Caldimonas sp.]